MTRTVVLLDERDRPVGRAQVPELTFVIKHDDRNSRRAPVKSQLRAA